MLPEYRTIYRGGEDEIIEKMQENDENEVLIYEMQYFIEK